MELRCASCSAEVSTGRGAVKFKCPSCSEIVVRCGSCRKGVREWKCTCGFEGP